MEIIKSQDDFYTSVEKSLDEIDLKWRSYNGLLVLGSHFPKDVEKKIDAIRKARQEGTPFLGICFGMQLAAIEYARTYLGIKDATSEELSEKGTHIITKLPRIRVGIRKVAGWWGQTEESHWHNFEMSGAYIQKFLTEWDISESEDGVVEIMKFVPHPFFVGVQFHPEYQSTKEKPHPLLVDFINVCRN